MVSPIESETKGLGRPTYAPGASRGYLFHMSADSDGSVDLAFTKGEYFTFYAIMRYLNVYYCAMKELIEASGAQMVDPSELPFKRPKRIFPREEAKKILAEYFRRKGKVVLRQVAADFRQTIATSGESIPPAMGGPSPGKKQGPPSAKARGQQGQ